jgi:undecaprenyl-diphosphatase
MATPTIPRHEPPRDPEPHHTGADRDHAATTATRSAPSATAGDSPEVRSAPSVATGEEPRVREPVATRRCWPLRARSVGVLVGAYVLYVALWTLVGLFVVHVLADTWVGARELRVSTWLAEHRTATLDDLSRYGSLVSDTFTKLIAVPLLGAAFVIAWKRWHDAVFLAAVMLFEVSVFATAAYLVGRERPPVEQLDGSLPTNSFPSGHVAASVAFYVGLFLIARWHTRRRAVLVPVGALAVLAPLVVATSRLYRGMHYLSDVLAGAALGAASLVAVFFALQVGMRRLAATCPSLPPTVTQLDLTHGGDPS